MPYPSDNRNVFISYSYDDYDKDWADWIYWELKEAGYKPFLSRALRAGANIIREWQEAFQGTDRFILILSPAYMEALSEQVGWDNAILNELEGKKGSLLLVVVKECERKGFLATYESLDVTRKDEIAARNMLLAAMTQKGSYPATQPKFPLNGGSPSPSTRPPFPEMVSPIWTIPRGTNPFFTGREDILEKIHVMFKAGRADSQALCGLGGIGKTQIAIRYAQRYGHEYKVIIWMDASSSQSIYESIATASDRSKKLHLLKKDMQTQQTAIQAMRSWLQRNTSWLLILDQADDLAIIYELIPQKVEGHILLTTRRQMVENFIRIDVDAMSDDDGACLLLKRAKISEEHYPLEFEKARDIAAKLSGFPLALDQAGAYIEKTTCGLDGYLQRYQQNPLKLLENRGRETYVDYAAEHPDSLVFTILSDVKKIEQVNPAAVDLLRFFTFLDSSSILDEIIQRGAPELGPALQPFAQDLFKLDDLMRELSKFSIVRRQPETNMLVIHPLVQTILRRSMDGKICQLWAERAVKALRRALPDPVTIDHCQRYRLHLNASIEYINYWGMRFAEANELVLFVIILAWQGWHI